jgi:Ca2+:H+ antiporter
LKYLKFLLLFIPVSIIAEFTHLNPKWIFILSALSILPLAGILSKSTEELSIYTGSRIGGFINATFGNATELIISFFALKAGLFDVVKASIAGSVLGNVLLVLGASMLAGGIKYKTQSFNKNAINVSSSMLMFSIFGLCVPAIFMYTVSPDIQNTSKYEFISIGIAILMFLVYISGLFFSFYTHKNLYGNPSEDGDYEKATWSLKKSILILISTTLLIALESEYLVSSVEPMTKSFGISQIFVGIILIPIIGNAAEHSTAIVMALKNKMNVSVEIAVGSSLQIILFVTPLLIFLSLLFKPMSIVFNSFELVTLTVATLIANKVGEDGESNWLEGALLIALYIIIALCFLII